MCSKFICGAEWRKSSSKESKDGGGEIERALKEWYPAKAQYTLNFKHPPETGCIKRATARVKPQEK